jgi:sporulation protein YlmC with PRC-barrel domain
MRFTELLKMEVVDRDGNHLGRVVELRCAGEPERGCLRAALQVTELIYGKAGSLKRLGFRAVEERRVAWASVIAVGDGKIIIEVN